MMTIASEQLDLECQANASISKNRWSFTGPDLVVINVPEDEEEEEDVADDDDE